MNLNTLKKPVVLEQLSKGAVIEYSAWFGTANLKLNGEIIGRVHISTFNSLYAKKVIKREELHGSKSIYSLSESQDEMVK